MDAQRGERLRQRFRGYLNPFMLALWRLDMGRWFELAPALSGRVLVLTHTGRTSGLQRRQPLNYAVVEGDLCCVAAFGEISDWYRNVLAEPNVEVWLPDGWWAGVAEDASDAPDRLRLIREVLIGSGFAAYVAGLNPRQMTDEALEAESRDYRLLRIRRTDPRTGPGGPGDLGWVWQLTTFLLLGLGLLRRRSRGHQLSRW